MNSHIAHEKLCSGLKCFGFGIVLVILVVEASPLRATDSAAQHVICNLDDLHLVFAVVGQNITSFGCLRYTVCMVRVRSEFGQAYQSRTPLWTCYRCTRPLSK